jgi:hypothetical protein
VVDDHEQNRNAAQAIEAAQALLGSGCNTQRAATVG